MSSQAAPGLSRGCRFLLPLPSELAITNCSAAWARSLKPMTPPSSSNPHGGCAAGRFAALSGGLFLPVRVAVPCFCSAGRGPLAKNRPLPLLRLACFCRRQRLGCAATRPPAVPPALRARPHTGALNHSRLPYPAGMPVFSGWHFAAAAQPALRGSSLWYIPPEGGQLSRALPAAETARRSWLRS